MGTCLNPLHTTLAVFGCLLGHSSIAEEMHDPELASFLRAQAAEALPKAVRPQVCTAPMICAGVMADNKRALISQNVCKYESCMVSKLRLSAPQLLKGAGPGRVPEYLPQ